MWASEEGEVGVGVRVLCGTLLVESMGGESLYVDRGGPKTSSTTEPRQARGGWGGCT